MAIVSARYIISTTRGSVALRTQWPLTLRYSWIAAAGCICVATLLQDQRADGREADKRIEEPVGLPQLADALEGETASEGSPKQGSMHRIQHENISQWCRHKAILDQTPEVAEREGKQNEAGKKYPLFAKPDPIGKTAVTDIALIVPHFLGEMAGGEDNGEKEADKSPTQIDPAPQGISHQEVQHPPGEMQAGREHRNTLAMQAWMRIEEPQGDNRRRQEKSPQGQQAKGHQAQAAGDQGEE